MRYEAGATRLEVGGKSFAVRGKNLKPNAAESETPLVN